MLIDTNISLEVQLDQEMSSQASNLLEAVSNNKVQGYITEYSIDSVVIIMEHCEKSPDEIKKFID